MRSADVIFELKTRFYKDGVSDLSAQLAYYFLLSLFPFLIVAISLLGYFPVSTHHVLDFIKPYAPPYIHQLIKNNLDSILGVQRGNLLSFSVLGTIWLTSRGIRSIARILNHTYGVKEDRPFWRSGLERLFLVFGLLAALVVSLLLPLMMKLVEWIILQAGLTLVWVRLWIVIRYLLSSLVLFFAFFCLYYFAPNVRMRPGEALPGTLFATLGWQLISVGYSGYVMMGDYSQIYGNLGGVMVLLIWFYLSAMILIVGGQLNAVLFESRVRPVKPNQ
ncbi:membrane protein [Melghirimyces profundicolus]|uniref:Membrane protein n=1 Tax=Melghirimyces profundicolus TaxID=1242148 RepID=A0A2T6BRZ6_9BACL|nr:YihY/virulence factor BrkB family protein [Melghirimyces profundicolus]PTX58832.1 membrane protein [Melghirimyces profundicolus]